ncbi:hypothetical protein PMW_78 [Pseudomonas phage phiPMW]|uniref:Uncharacterized protein n=1 Tax=Pseudomonas phage phiPMW TaxID=1815582 RepID=A0A1S5R1B4_9CAUD|nr:hypothetical protein FDG97_gp078 [Pseudomonas phage phiPMW]ANA49203.1 hypothetical protein PMW_78 [Pseudomonas phage phiPMW]
MSNENKPSQAKFKAACTIGALLVILYVFFFALVNNPALIGVILILSFGLVTLYGMFQVITKFYEKKENQ